MIQNTEFANNDYADYKFKVNTLDDIEAIEVLIDNGVYPDQVEFDGVVYINLHLINPDDLEKLFDNMRNSILGRSREIKALRKNIFFRAMTPLEIGEYCRLMRASVYQLMLCNNDK